MPQDNPLVAALSGWTMIWPTALLALIWLAFVASWVIASFWQGQTKKHVVTTQSLRYRLPILAGAILFVPATSRLLGLSIDPLT